MSIQKAWEIILRSRDVFFTMQDGILDCFEYIPHSSIHYGDITPTLCRGFIMDYRRKEAIEVIQTHERFWYSLSPAQREIYFFHYLPRKYYPIVFQDVVIRFHYRNFSIEEIAVLLLNKSEKFGKGLERVREKNKKLRSKITEIRQEITQIRKIMQHFTIF